jgi:hypothetical protein
VNGLEPTLLFAALWHRVLVALRAIPLLDGVALHHEQEQHPLRAGILGQRAKHSLLLVKHERLVRGVDVHVAPHRRCRHIPAAAILIQAPPGSCLRDAGYQADR